MRVALLHNYYTSSGGEDVVFEAEAKLLRDEGHDVDVVAVANRPDATSGVVLAANSIWNHNVYRNLRKRIAQFRPEIVHIHNTFHSLSMSVAHAAKAEGAAIVHTLHNFRPICANATLMRDGRPCELCLRQPLPIPSLVHRCYHGSLVQTAAVGVGSLIHSFLGTYSRTIDALVTPSDFAKSRFVQAGYPEELLLVKPHFVAEPADYRLGGGGDYALYVGRLSPEKGIDVLLDAWRQVGARIGLRIVGSGPLEQRVRAEAVSNSSITFLGQKPRDQVFELMRNALFLVVPSVSYETFGLVAIESLSVGTPVIASNVGALPEVVLDGNNGFLFERGNSKSLASAVDLAVGILTGDNKMRERARASFESRYSTSANYGILMRVYDIARARATEN